MKNHFLRSIRKGIQFVGSTTGGNNQGASTYSVDIPTQRREGDLIVVAFGCASTINISQGSVSGYTTLFDLYASDDRDANLCVMHRISDGTETTVSVQGNDFDSPFFGCSAVVQVWRNVNRATPMDVTRTTATGTNSGVPNPPAITPATAGAVILGVGLTPAISTLTAPAGTTDATTTRVTGFVGSAIIMCAYKDWVSGSYDMAAFGGASTSTTLSWAAAAIALRPAYPGSKPI